MSLAVYYQAAVVLFSLSLLGTALLNFLCFRKPQAFVSTGGDAALPLISILVPARNEADNIGECIRSLLALNYPNFEVIALDDRSQDATYPILCRLRDQDHRLRVLVGSEPPPGWYGKPHACWQLAQAARGEYLLMTDADCRFAPDALLLALGALKAQNADVVSLVPDLHAEGFWERLLIPIQYFIIYAFLPTPLVRRSRNPAFAAANGAFLFLTRSTYFAVDGHRAVRQQITEDIKFAQHVKSEGKTLWYGDGSRTYSVRMYHSFEEIWAGFSKNLYGAFGNPLLLAFVLVMIVCGLILPLFFVVWGSTHNLPWTSLAVIAYAIPILIRLGLTARYNRDTVLYAFLHPLAWSVIVGIAVNSAYRALSGRGTEWKGRIYRNG